MFQYALLGLADHQQARELAQARCRECANNRLRGRALLRGQTVEDATYLGIMGEMGLSQIFDSPFDDEVRTTSASIYGTFDSRLPDGRRVDVKTTRHPQSQLRVSAHKFPKVIDEDWVFALMFAEFPFGQEEEPFPLSFRGTAPADRFKNEVTHNGATFRYLDLHELDEWTFENGVWREQIRVRCPAA